MNIKKTWEIEKEIDIIRNKLRMSDSIKMDAQLELEKERFGNKKWVAVDEMN